MTRHYYALAETHQSFLQFKTAVHWLPLLLLLKFWTWFVAGTWLSALLGLISKVARFQSSQVVKTSFGFHLRECMGSSSSPPPPPPPPRVQIFHKAVTMILSIEIHLMLHRMVNRGYNKAEYGFYSDSI